LTRLTAAEQLLQELGITEPEEIDLEAIAWHIGAIVKYQVLDGSEARIVGTGDRAIITVNAASTHTRQRFSIGHEIGHWYYHCGRILVCRSEEIGQHGDGGSFLERQADAFAADLLLPGYVLRPRVRQFKALTFDVVCQVAKLFNTSLPATAIRLVEQGFWPAMLVCHSQLGRRWFVRSLSLPEGWYPRDDLDSASYAFGILFGNDSDQTRPRAISAQAWFRRWDAERYRLQEQSIRTMEGETLSLLVMEWT
jgi:Zn-dependent peptidase ImmA (M78 family)